MPFFDKLRVLRNQTPRMQFAETSSNFNRITCEIFRHVTNLMKFDVILE